MSTELQRAVVNARERVEDFKGKKDASYEVWRQTNNDLLDEYSYAQHSLTQVEEALRAAGLRDYEVNGNKHPIPGVGIRVRERLVYPVGQALLWANDHKMALVLDTKEFERLMKAQAVLPAWASMEEDVTATIATDLTKVLEGVGE